MPLDVVQAVIHLNVLQRNHRVIVGYAPSQLQSMKSVVDLSQLLWKIQLIFYLAHLDYHPEGSDIPGAQLAPLSVVDDTLLR